MKKVFTIQPGFFPIKVIFIVIVCTITSMAFASLGSGSIRIEKKPKSSLLSGKSKSETQLKSFSLKSGYQFRGNHVIAPQAPQIIDLSTVLTYRTGAITYALPLKKKVLIDNVKFSFVDNNNIFRRY